MLFAALKYFIYLYLQGVTVQGKHTVMKTLVLHSSSLHDTNNDKCVDYNDSLCLPRFFFFFLSTIEIVCVYNCLDIPVLDFFFITAPLAIQLNCCVIYLGLQLRWVN